MLYIINRLFGIKIKKKKKKYTWSKTGLQLKANMDYGLCLLDFGYTSALKYEFYLVPKKVGL